MVAGTVPLVPPGTDWLSPSLAHYSIEDRLDHLSSMVLQGRRSHGIRTLLAMDVHEAQDHVSHSAILAILEWLPLPPRIRNFVSSFLDDRYVAIRIGKERAGHFTVRRGVSQDPLLAQYCLT